MADDVFVQLQKELEALAQRAIAADVREPFAALLRGQLAALTGSGVTDAGAADNGAANNRSGVAGATTAPVALDAVPERFGMVGASPAMTRFFDMLAKVVHSDVSVLVLGETGTGKELVARALVREGPRAKGPFVAVNCAAVPPNLLESELFGHKRGSFTGAVSDREGHFATAHGGTLFLDEIGDMPLPMQAKLLRALQEGEVRPVGSNRSRKVDVRVVAATHRDLLSESRAGTFREDLYYRLAVVTLALPPLRERAGDVALLVRALLPRLAAELGLPGAVVLPEALTVLEAWPWPGNVRELENELRRALALAPGPIGPDELSAHLRQPPSRSGATKT